MEATKTLYFTAAMGPFLREHSLKLSECPCLKAQQHYLYYRTLDALARSDTLPHPHTPFYSGNLPKTLGPVRDMSYVPFVVEQMLKSLEAVRRMAARSSPVAGIVANSFPREPIVRAMDEYFGKKAWDYARIMRREFGKADDDSVAIHVASPPGWAPVSVAAPAQVPLSLPPPPDVATFRVIETPAAAAAAAQTPKAINLSRTLTYSSGDDDADNDTMLLFPMDDSELLNHPITYYDSLCAFEQIDAFGLTGFSNGFY